MEAANDKAGQLTTLALFEGRGSGISPPVHQPSGHIMQVSALPWWGNLTGPDCRVTCVHKNCHFVQYSVSSDLLTISDREIDLVFFSSPPIAQYQESGHHSLRPRSAAIACAHAIY